MRPYNGDRNKHRTINRDDIYHITQDAGGRDQRKAAAKRARKAARQHSKKEIENV